MTDEDTAADSQYGTFTTDAGDVVVYDRHNPEAWIQSTYSVEVGGERADETSA